MDVIYLKHKKNPWAFPSKHFAHLAYGSENLNWSQDCHFMIQNLRHPVYLCLHLESKRTMSRCKRSTTANAMTRRRARHVNKSHYRSKIAYLRFATSTNAYHTASEIIHIRIFASVIFSLRQLRFFAGPDALSDFS